MKSILKWLGEWGGLLLDMSSDFEFYTQIFSQISVKKDTAHNGNYLNELRSLFNIELLN